MKLSGSEIPNVEAERATARAWVSEHYNLIQSSLQHRLDAKLAEYSDVSRTEVLVQENLSGDPFSNRFCGVWVLDVPESELGSMQRVGANRPREKTVHFKDPATGKKIERGHTHLGCGRIIADAVFGQFVDLDKAISKRPNLFVNRVFVGTKQEAARAFHVKY